MTGDTMFAKRLKQLRTARTLTQEALATKAGIGDGKFIQTSWSYAGDFQ